MDLMRRNTRFGLPSFRGSTPESDGESNVTVSDSDSSRKLRKRSLASQNDETPLKMRRFSPGRDGEEVGTSPKVPYFPQTIQPNFREVGIVRMKHSSPWKSLEKCFSLLLNDSVTIALQEDGRFVAVREFSDSDAARKVNTLQKIQRRIRHENLLAFLDCFITEESHYAVFEHEMSTGEKFSITLTHYALIVPYPTEQQLATILRQILDGLKFLATLGLEHGALRCKNVLIGTQGSIKIASQECCRELVSNRDSIRDIRGVGYIAMELMNKEAKYNGPMNVRDVRRWPLDSRAFKFLLITESAYSIDELRKHPLFNYERQEIDLKAAVYTAEVSTHRGYNLI